MTWKIIDQDGTVRETLNAFTMNRLSKERQRAYADAKAKALTRFSGGKWRCKAIEQ